MTGTDKSQVSKMAPTGAHLPTVTCCRIRAFFDDIYEPAAAFAKKTGVSTRTVERMRIPL